MKDAKIVADKIHLNTIKPLKEYIDNEFSSAQLEIKLGVSQSTMHNLANKSFRITISIFFEYESVTIAEYLYDFTFQVENMEDFLINNDDKEKPFFSGNLIGTLLSITYSTMRGILHIKLADTYLKHFILPIINPNNLLKQKIQDAN